MFMLCIIVIRYFSRLIHSWIGCHSDRSGRSHRGPSRPSKASDAGMRAARSTPKFEIRQRGGVGKEAEWGTEGGLPHVPLRRAHLGRVTFVGHRVNCEHVARDCAS